MEVLDWENYFVLYDQTFIKEGYIFQLPVKSEWEKA